MEGAHRRPRTSTRLHRIHVRFTPEELARIRDAAAAPGRKVSMARFIAEAALTAAGSDPPLQVRGAPTRLALAEIADAAIAVSRVGNNLNQLARRQHISGERPPEADDVVALARQALEALVVAVERARP